MSAATDWAPLRAELARWRSDGLRPLLWWRDDDAVRPTAALDRLLSLAEAASAPLSLAVIPAGAEPTLAARLDASAARTRVLPHGWRHENHAPPGEKKAEFRAHRPLKARLVDVAAGWARIEALFGARAAPVFTPPWNRVGNDLFSALPAHGIRGVSVFGARAAAEAAPGLMLINTHIDPIAWRSGGGLLDGEALGAVMAARLAAERAALLSAPERPPEPLGLLTHHLVHDDAIWEFTAAFWAEMQTAEPQFWSPAAL